MQYKTKFTVNAGGIGPLAALLADLGRGLDNVLPVTGMRVVFNLGIGLYPSCVAESPRRSELERQIYDDMQSHVIVRDGERVMPNEAFRIIGAKYWHLADRCGMWQPRRRGPSDSAGLLELRVKAWYYRYRDKLKRLGCRTGSSRAMRV